MKVMLVNGSPHEKSCTYTALCEVASTLENEDVQAEIFWIGNKAINGCVACGGCINTGKCVFNDAVNEFAAKAAEADGFIFGSPVHYASIAGAMSCFMDRLFYSAPASVFYLKPAAGVINARRAGTTASFDQINKYFTISQMPVVSSRYWNVTHGTTPEEVALDGEGMQIMRVLARNMAYLLKCKQAARAAGVPLPETEKRIATNFIKK